jgi:beta-N-acetylhexosaminidase
MPRLSSSRRRFVAALTVLTLGASGCVAAAAQRVPDEMVKAGTAKRSAPVDAWARSVLRTMNLREKVGQLFVSQLHGQSADQADPKNRQDFGVDTPAEVVRKYALGGVIYFDNSDSDNIDSPAQIAGLSNGLQRAAMSSNSKLPLSIGTDQESGRVTRIGAPATEFPGAMSLGAAGSPEAAEQAARIMGSELRAMGITQNYAPDADVNSNPANPVIGIRSFSGNPALAARMVAAQVAGYQGSVAATAKHFPGHGDTDTDSHVDLPVINSTKDHWEKVDAAPFRAAIEAGIDTIMSGHLKFPKIDPSGEPGTLSPAILTGLLRKELGFTGVVVTDSLRMEGVRTMHPDERIPVLALKAGADQLLMPANLDVAIKSVLAAVRGGELTEQRIDQSVLRILKVKRQHGVLADPLVDVAAVSRTVGTKAHLAAAQRITDGTVTVVRNDAKLLPLRKKPDKVLVTGAGTDSAATLARQIGARGPAATAVPTGTEPSDETIDKAVNAAKANDLVVVLTNGAGTDPQQQKLVKALGATGRPVVGAALGVPYDPGYLDGQQTWLLTYSTMRVATESLAKVIFGEVSPKGKLPVDIPAGADQSTVRYPFGTGLTW